MRGLSFQVGTAVSLGYDENRMLGVQVDAHGENAGDNGRFCLGSYGLIGRPLAANDEGLGAPVLYADEGREGFAWVGFDHRDLEIAPPLTDGSVALYNSRGAFWLLDYDTETATFYVPMDDGAKAHCFVVGKDANGKRATELRHSDGGYFRIDENSAVIRHNGNGYIEIKGDKINLNGQLNNPSGGSFGGPASQPVVNATALAAAMSTAATAISALGGSPVKGTDLAPIMATLAAAISSACATVSLKAI